MPHALLKNSSAPAREILPVPGSLNLVASLFLLFGLYAVWETVRDWNLTNSGFDLGILGIPIFFGLRDGSTGWRTCALVLIWLGIISAALTTVVLLVTHVMAMMQPADVPDFWDILGSASLLGLNVWQHRVLHSAEVLEFFFPPYHVKRPTRPHPAEQPAAVPPTRLF